MAGVKREALLALGLRTEEVPVPELGNGTVVRVREMTVARREIWEAAAFEVVGEIRRARAAEFRAQLIIAGAVDEEGAPLFGPEDVGVVNGLPAAVGERIALAVLRVNGLNDTEATLKGN